MGGGSSIVDATSWDAVEGFEVTAAPSMRMVVSLADWDDSRWINLTGVSGHPASSHYSDQTELFVDGETLPWAFTREAVAGRRRGPVGAHARRVSDPRISGDVHTCRPKFQPTSGKFTGYPGIPRARAPRPRAT